MDKGQKKEAAKRRIKQLVEMGEPFEQKDVAEELGVARKTVSDAVKELEDSNEFSTKLIRSKKRKRQQVKEALEEIPFH